MIANLSPEDAYKRVTDQQKLAAEPGASSWVSANAGSGKTKVLIDRVARLLLSGAEPDSILCITYTKAAASEMQQRLFKRLGSWSVMGDEDLASDLEDLQNEKITQYDTERLKKARALFARALETPGGLRIETLHAFAGRVLRRFPLEADVPPGFTELDELDGGRLWEKAARKAFEESYSNPESRKDFRTLIKNVGGLGLKGAVDLIKFNAIKLRDFLAAFPDPLSRREALNQALNAPDMDEAAFLADVMGASLPSERLERAIDLYLDAGGKQNEGCASRLRNALRVKDPASSFELYRSFLITGKGTPSTKLLTKALEGTLVEDLFHPATGQETNRIVAAVSALSAIRLRDRTLALLAIAEPVLAEHTHQKRLQAGLDFDDLILETKSLLTRSGLAEWVLYKLDGGISHVLLDEAQDTSPDQWVIVNALVSEFFAGASVSDQVRTLFVVGDEKQSIYSFQGADTAQFQSERQRFAGRSGQEAEIHLPEIEMSFRTVPQVLHFVDSVFNGMTDFGRAPFSTEIATEADRIAHHAFRHTQPGKVEVWPLEAPERADKGVAWHAPLDMEREVSAPAQLSEKIADWIKARIESDEGIWSDERQPKPARVHAGDILILVRSRGPLFHALIQALKAAELPVAGADRVNLLDTLAVQDLLNLVRFALCPEDDLTVAEILKGPFIGLFDDDKHLFPLAYKRENASLWERVQASDQNEHQIARQLLDDVLAAKHLPAFEFLNHFMTRTYAPLDLTGWQMMDSRFGSPARDPLEALLGIAGGMEDASSASLQTFLHAVESQDSDIKRELSGPSGEIRVMTVHGAKGLEAPIVILPDTTGVSQDRLTGSVVFSDEGYPIWMEGASGECDVAAAIREREKARQRAESHRLLYVALTRARDQLVICGSWRGSVQGKGYSEGSWFDLCQETLTAYNGVPGARWEDGHFIYGNLPNIEDAVAVPVEMREKRALPDWLSQPVRPVRDMKEQRAPSQLLPGDTPVLPPFGENNQKRFQRGRLIHALLEILPDVPLEEREDRARRFLNRCLDTGEADLLEDVLKTSFGVLNDPSLAEVFGPGGRAEAPIVGTGPNLPEGLVINGRIDRMRVTDDEVLVIDYKTDRPPPASEADVALPYLAQLGAYYDVLSCTYPDKRIRCALLWTHTPHFMVLSESAMMAALTKSRDEV